MPSYEIDEQTYARQTQGRKIALLNLLASLGGLKK